MGEKKHFLKQCSHEAKDLTTPQRKRARITIKGCGRENTVP